jgi:hypothetical protein
LGGALVALATVLARNANLAVGSAYGSNEGFLVVPGLLVPYVLFVGWSSARRGGAKPRAKPRDLFLFVLGVHFGMGLVATNPLGAVLAGFIFVDGSALLAAAGLYWARRVEDRTVVVGAVLTVLAAFVVVVIYHLVLAFIAGAAVAYLEREPTRRRLVALLLAVLTLIVAVVPLTASPAIPSMG